MNFLQELFELGYNTTEITTRKSRTTKTGVKIPIKEFNEIEDMAKEQHVKLFTEFDNDVAIVY